MTFSLRNLRFRCAISWIQSYYDDVTFPFPREVLSYPYTDLYTFKIRAELVWWLTKGDPYFCLLAHIDSISKVSSFEVAINRLDLSHVLEAGLLARNDPFSVDQHLELLEAVMSLFASSLLSVDCIAGEICKLTGFNVPVAACVEDGLLLWVQTVCDKLRDKLDSKLIPNISSLSSSFSNGCLFLLILHFYVPQCVQVSNGKFPTPSEPLGLEEAFHNSTIVTNACMQIPHLKFCLSSQGIVRSCDPQMLTYVISSLASMFLCFQVSESIYTPPPLYGALIGQSPHPSILASARFHSMDSVARKSSDVRNNLLTPSASNLLLSMHSNPSSLYPGYDSSRIGNRPLSRRAQIQTVKSTSTPELSRLCPQGTDLLRQTQDLTHSGIIGVIHPPAVECDIHTELSAVPQEAWSPLKEVQISSNSLEDGSSTCSGSSIPSSQSVAKQEIVTNTVIHLNIFSSPRPSQSTNPACLLLRTEAIKLKSDQSTDSSPPPDNEATRHLLGQLAFSYVLSNHKQSYEEFICTELKISSVDRIDEFIRNRTEVGTIQIPNLQGEHIPICENSNQVAELPEESATHTPPANIEIDSKESNNSETTKPQTYFTTVDVTRKDSPFATERARNMLRMLETRNSARQTSKQTSRMKPQIAKIDLVTPSGSSHSLQSLHSNNIPIQQPGNHESKATRTKQTPEIAPTFSKHKSNKQIIKNAISDVCLAGGPNVAKKIEILRNLCESQSDHFLILFRDIIGCKFRGIYAYFSETEAAKRIGGSGPRDVTCDMLVKLYKYNSGAKEFQEIPARNISSSIDAFTIHDTLWTSKKRPVHLYV